MTAILVLALATVAMAADSLVGTWKLNLAKSKYSPGMAPKSQTVKNEAQENGIKQVFDGIGPDGKAFRLEYAGKYDGKDYPMKGDSTIDSMAYTKIEVNTIEIVQKQGPKVVGKARCVISKDGKTATVTYSQGQNGGSTEVWDKQ